MLKGKISASMMCASLIDLKDDVRNLEEAGVEYLHIDIMDGVFVPNIMLSNAFILALRSITDLPLDIHLMITQPENKVEWFDIRKNDIVSIHYESTSNVIGTLQLIEKIGGIPAVALSPATPISVLTYLLENLKMINIMAVNPGFAGREMVPMTLDKIRDTRTFLDTKGKADIMIEVDGNVTFDNAARMREAGADIFVAGSSSIFKANKSVKDTVDNLRDAILGY
ncbi:MAG: ribulose-phosphate 3-epimerase [Acidaminococcaceae bacterium]|nr:ribulose-phosphate 3-epimerase [Acidaminococcaceae bacterium]